MGGLWHATVGHRARTYDGEAHNETTWEGIVQRSFTTSMTLKTGVFLTGIAALTLGAGALSTPAFAFQTLNAKGVYTVNNPYDFQRVATVHMEGPKGHGDGCAFDPQTNRIFCSMHDHGVDVVSTKTNKSIKFIADIKGPSDIEYYDGYIYVAEGPGSGAFNGLTVINGKSLQIVTRVKANGTSSDEIVINPVTKTLYMGNDDNNAVDIFNISNPAHPVLKTTFHMLPPNPVSGVDDGAVAPDLNALFWSDDNYVNEYNATTGQPEHMLNLGIPLRKFGGTKNERYDATNKTLWVITTDPGQYGLYIINAKDDTIIKTLPTSGGGDGITIDPSLHLLYAFNRWHGSHGFDVFDMTKEERIAHINVPSGQTHTGAVDTNNHVIYAFGGDEGILVGFKPVPVRSAMSSK
jgi:DNA-binding beta-propeller fold protein YncE